MNKINIHQFHKINAQTWHSIMMLRSQVFVTEQQCVYTDPDLHDLNAYHVYAEDDGKVIAYARLFKDIEWKIGRVVAHESHRNQGKATALMNACLEHIDQREPNAKISLSAQVYLTPFYRSLGFEIEGSMYLEDGIPHLKMVYKRSRPN